MIVRRAAKARAASWVGLGGMVGCLFSICSLDGLGGAVQGNSVVGAPLGPREGESRSCAWEELAAGLSVALSYDYRSAAVPGRAGHWEDVGS